MHEQSRPFLTLITPPEGADREATARLLAEATGYDATTLRMRLGQPPPMIAGEFEPHAARRAVDSIVRHGGDAFAPTLGDITALGPTRKVRDLRLGGAGLEIDLWRGPSTTVAPREVRIIVRGAMSESKTTGRALTALDVLGASTANPRTAGMAVGWGVGGAYGLAFGLYRSWQSGEFRPERTIHASHKLDFHTTDGRVFQIDGDKFGYGILGRLRGYSDNENIDRMCELFVHLNPDAVVDPYFRLFRPPSGHKRLRLPDMKINKDDPAFAFYSRWAALMYRHVMGES
ncbi:MAG: hypothetical protein SYC29_18715 [Planctomycetota bacterium]|nr:hypothetical protein [Planctomycetota bacterium]